MPEPRASEVEWWSEGVRFSCIGCGRCCRGEPGAIFFTPGEEARIRDSLGIDEAAFRRTYVTGKWGRPSFVERRNGDCVFYDPESAKCSIYPLRPAQCSLFPFWFSVMESREEWDRQARQCPGMNEGRLRTAGEIRKLLEQNPFRDL
ncbi:MAG: YkgJ family cysteine cluster protein [Synergistaceae bacterium]|jgi:Fe-S-cluster containining protein|nr:YkgJ family cysteine cluster protein [Synergistaceae bacterium]